MGNQRGAVGGEFSTSSSAPALQRLRGTTEVMVELAELEEERTACQGGRARRPWELFQDGALRRQVISLVVLGSAMELCGNDSVRALPLPMPWVWGLCAAGPWEPPEVAGISAPELTLRPSSQIYAYASSVFLEAGIPQEKVQYAIVGTGCCELLTAFISVSLAAPPPAQQGGVGC